MTVSRSIANVVRVRRRDSVDEDAERLAYWASRTSSERLLAVEELRSVSTSLERAITVRRLGSPPVVPPRAKR